MVCKSGCNISYQNNFLAIIQALFEISIDSNEKSMTKLEAKKLYLYFEEFEIALLLILWNKLLKKINAANKICNKKIVIYQKVQIF